ncbi:MAG: hypothetical protein OEV52_07065 [Dehalococcoidia bacterium]|nr:hypothetical protein [Dehalococcoidia bacterium]MDH4292276.1 hypothetical protein [Dehalococcoidia bacterium]
MKKTLRDKSRDELARNLNSLGIRADLAERGRAEEKIENSWYQRSLGIIDIPEGSARWINILKKDASKNSPPLWWVVLCIPDKRPVPNHHVVDIKTVRKRSFPLFGTVVDVTWKGSDHHTGLAEVLSNNETVKDLAKRIGTLVIRSYAKEFEGWTLQVDRRFEPTNQDWATIQRIADHILSSPRMF